MKRTEGWGFLFFALLGALVLSSFPPAAMAKDPVPSAAVPNTLGVAHYYSITRTYPGFNAKTLDRLAANQFAMVRYVPDWQLIEQKKGVYDFSYADTLFQQFTVRRIRPVIGLGLNNPLYGVKTRVSTPAQREAFGKFVEQLVRRYKGRKVIWEIWNEPNIPSFWRPLAGETLARDKAVDEYLALVNEIVPIIRKEDPNALIIGPSAANYNTAWLLLALRKGLLSQLDGLSVHPYQPGGYPELMIAQHNQVQTWIPAADRKKPIFFTEVGYSVGKGGNEVDATKQANYLVRQYLLSLMLGVKGNIFYSLVDTADNREPCASPDHCYGLFSQVSGIPKPGFTALEGVIQSLKGYTFKAKISVKPTTTYVLQFNNNQGKVKYAVWDSHTTTSQAVVLPNKQKVNATQAVQIIG